MGKKFLIRIDWMGGLAVGALFVVFHRLLAELYQLPVGLVLGIAAVNLGYGMVSWTLWRRARGEEVAGLAQMGLANLGWGGVCFVLLAVWMDQASWLGRMHFVVEGLFVGGLGWLEWRAGRAR